MSKATMSPRRLAQVYREAARKVAEGESHYACNAIHEASTGHKAGSDEIRDEDPCVQCFANYLRPIRAPKDEDRGGWYGHAFFGPHAAFYARRNARVLALCLMAAIAEAGDA